MKGLETGVVPEHCFCVVRVNGNLRFQVSLLLLTSPILPFSIPDPCQISTWIEICPVQMIFPRFTLGDNLHSTQRGTRGDVYRQMFLGVIIPTSDRRKGISLSPQFEGLPLPGIL
jgi:hypothetical protein